MARRPRAAAAGAGMTTVVNLIIVSPSPRSPGTVESDSDMASHESDRDRPGARAWPEAGSIKLSDRAADRRRHIVPGPAQAAAPGRSHGIPAIGDTVTVSPAPSRPGRAGPPSAGGGCH